MLGRDAVFGRDAELAAIDRLIEQQPRTATLAVVEGDAGVGKTAIWEAATSFAAERGVCVLAARANLAEATSAFTAIDDLLRPLIDGFALDAEPGRRALASALLVANGVAAPDPRAAALGLLSVLAELAGTQRVVVAVDDWQWLDRASADVLGFAVRRCAPFVLILATARTGEAGNAVGELVRSMPEDATREIVVGPLDPPHLQRVIHARTGRWLSPPDLARLHTASRGNVLTALELVRAAESPHGATAADARRLFAPRLCALPASTRDTLRCVAVLPAPTVEQLQRLVEDPLALPADVEAALAAEILEPDGPRLRFGHPLFAEVVRRHTAPDHWRDLHRQAAAMADDVEQRGRHLAAAAGGPDEAAASAVEDAAAHAGRRGALVAAAELAQLAFELTPRYDVPARSRRGLNALDTMRETGQGRAARRLARTLSAELPAGPLRAAVLWRLAYLVADDTSESLIRQALNEAGDDRRILAEIELLLFQFLTMSGRGAAAGRHAEAALTHANAIGDPHISARALVGVAVRRFLAGRGVQTEQLQRAAELERESSERATDASARIVLGVQQYKTGALDEGRATLHAELERAREDQTFDLEARARLQLADLEVRAGDLAAAREHGTCAVELARGMQIRAVAPAALWSLGRVHAYAGRHDEASEAADEVIALSGQGRNLMWSAFGTSLLGFVQLAREDYAAAASSLLPLVEVVDAMGVRDPEMYAFEPDLVEALTRLGDFATALSMQARLESYASTLGRPWITGTALRSRGLIAAARGSNELALAHLGASLPALRACGQPFEYARGLLAIGMTQRRMRRRSPARDSLQLATSIFRRHGAEQWALRSERELARIPGRRKGDAHDLSATERRVAELAAEGLSNQQIADAMFVSMRTVESNLTRVYEKLRIEKRTQLAAHLPAS